MKKTLFCSVLALLAIMMSGCKQEEPTAVLSENMNATVTIVGYVRITTNNGSEDNTAMRKGQEVVILRGTKIDEKTMGYERFTATTDNKGRFEMKLGVPAGKSIDEVKVIAEADLNQGAKVGSEVVGAHFYGEASKTDLKAYNGYEFLVEMTATAAKDAHKYNN